MNNKITTTILSTTLILSIVGSGFYMLNNKINKNTGLINKSNDAAQILELENAISKKQADEPNVNLDKIDTKDICKNTDEDLKLQEKFDQEYENEIKNKKTSGKIFIKPTEGIITQNYHSGHLAIDIANESKPDVNAADSGVVLNASSGTWGGGYGNYVLIYHGNGVKTLYAHLDTVDVKIGDIVKQGDKIGVMGNTGRIYGVTGAHLHWEVIIDCINKNPELYY